MTKKNQKLDFGFIEKLKQRWMATVDAIQDPIMIIGRDYTIEKTNTSLAKLSNSTVHEVIGTKCFKSFANRDSPCPGCAMLETFDKKDAVNYELNKVIPDKYYEVTAQPILMKDKIDGIVTIYRDRTLAKQMQIQLIQNEKLASIGLLAGGIAHEINNPLGGILIFSQMLLREIDKKTSQYQDVVEIEAAAMRCKEIVDNLLDFARLQPSKKRRTYAIDMKKAILAALKFCMVGTKTNIDIIEDWHHEPLFCQGNKNKIIQVFLNLIQNAVGSMAKGGTLELTSKTTTLNDRAWGVFSVKDTGGGIDEKILDRIFDPFFTSKPEGEGTGLGLSICHGIIKEYGGKIQVDTNHEGTTFRVLFPLTDSEKNTSAA